MSLPSYLASIKSSGIYRFEWDNSQIPAQQAETLRLLIGYSEKGPFNTLVYCESFTDFAATFGNISKRLERRGCFFHRLAEQALSTGPILALNLKPFESNEQVSTLLIDASDIASDSTIADLSTNVKKAEVLKIYDTNKFWTLDADTLPDRLNSQNYINIVATDSVETSCTIFIRRMKQDSGYNMTIRQWYNGLNEEMPEYLSAIQDENLADFFAEIYVFRGEFNDTLCASGVFKSYFKADDDGKYTINDEYTDSFGDVADALEALSEDSASNFIGRYQGCMIPNFKNANGTYVSLDLNFNADNYQHKMLMKFNEGALDDATGDSETLLGYMQIDKAAVVVDDGDTVSYPAIYPIYMPGYEYTTIAKTDKEATLQEKLFKVLSYKGIRKALTSRTDAEYHYIIDSFKSYVDGLSIKSALATICKEKKNAFAFIDFPSAQQFKDSGKYMSSATQGSSDIKYLDYGKVVNGISLVSKNNGASYCGYFTPLIISDGTVKTTIPSTALVSNNFMEKWGARHPYDIVAGPNYGVMTWDGLQGPDYTYSRTDLDYLEPFGVNCMVYVPRRGTYINSNQTAQQTPVSALSKINVRELVIYLQDEIENMMEGYHWDLNTQTLRDTIKSKADTILETVKNNGGVYAYNNWTDDSADVIDNEMVVLHTEIEPARGAGKMVEEIHIQRTGALSQQ